MISFAFTTDRIRSAPPEVRRWLEAEILGALREAAGPRPEPAHAPELAACTPQEALALFEAIRNDFATAQVFLELGREPPLPNSPPPLHVLAIGEFQRKLRLSDDRLVACFAALNHAFMRLRNDPEAVLLGFDDSSHVYLHAATHASIRALWEMLIATAAPERAAAPAIGFVPPEIGPAEAVAAHRGAVT
jgi:hypothetical protein